MKYRISSNNSRGDYFFFPHKMGVIICGKAIIQGRGLFKKLLNGSRAIKLKNDHIK